MVGKKVDLEYMKKVYKELTEIACAWTIFILFVVSLIIFNDETLKAIFLQVTNIFLLMLYWIFRYE